MKYTNVEKVQKFLDNKFGEKTCWVFATTGFIPSQPDYIKQKIELKDIKIAPFKGFFKGFTSGDYMVCAIDYYAPEQVDFSDFNDFVEPSIWLTPEQQGRIDMIKNEEK